MSETRKTSCWVPIDLVVPHPKNMNKMNDAAFEKLTRNIDSTGHSPPIIVRSLELSKAYADEAKAGKLQIIDGEHRWRYHKAKGSKEVEVCIWGGISDYRSDHLLATINYVHGDPVKSKKRALLRDLIETSGDPAALAQFLPETEEELRALIDSTASAAETTRKTAEAIGRQEPMTIFVLPEHAEVIRRAIKQAGDRVDADECQEGAALAHVCSVWLGETEPRD